jgi:tRNA C32,U32 (ribose-2'-O)-methylase TrmJ
MGIFSKNEDKTKKLNEKKKEQKKSFFGKANKAMSSGDKVKREEFLDLQMKLEIVANNCQYACDEVDKLNDIVKRMSGRMGL